MSEKEITKALFRYFEGREWACFDQLRLGSGWDCERTIDFFAMNTWPSKGHQTIAIEIKVSRSDFTREIRNPEKRLAAMTLCDRYFFVAPKGMLKQEDMPPNVALWEYDVDAKKMESMPHWYGTSKVAKLTVPSMSFVAAVLRRQAKIEQQADRNLNNDKGEG